MIRLIASESRCRAPTAQGNPSVNRESTHSDSDRKGQKRRQGGVCASSVCHHRSCWRFRRRLKRGRAMPHGSHSVYVRSPNHHQPFSTSTTPTVVGMSISTPSLLPPTAGCECLCRLERSSSTVFFHRCGYALASLPYAILYHLGFPHQRRTGN